LKYKHGLVLGKFLPPHRGHQFLIETALARCERLTVLACSLKREPIPGRLRYEWLREMFPSARVVHVTDENPQYPHEHPQFWDIWRGTILRHTNAPIEAVFTSEDYGDELARQIGAVHVLVDIDRARFPVSGTAVRANPLAHWEFIPEPARPYFVKRIALVGPESTGKTTLAQKLAEHFGTVWTPEYGREYVNTHPLNELTLKDIEAIARGQQAAEERDARRAHKLLFCDTDLLITTLWSRHFFGECPAWIEAAARAAHYDLTLLLTPEVAWVKDEQRVGQEFSRDFYQNLRRQLISFGRDFTEIKGNDYDARLRDAIAAVKMSFPALLDIRG
jgi:NadR type nicotinamide-nucleotide adenylyltransferase